jgi:hypothetical protein
VELERAVQGTYHPGVFDVNDMARRIRRGLKPGAGLFILNNDYRAIPTTERGWVNDGVDIKAMLNKEFVLRQEGRPSREGTTESLSRLTFWASYRSNTAAH